MTPVGPLDAEKTDEAVFLYVFRIAFTASLLCVYLSLLLSGRNQPFGDHRGSIILNRAETS